MSDSARPYTPTALPPVGARILAFVAILVGGLCGGLIGWSVTDLQCGTTDHPVVIGGAAPASTTTTTISNAPAPDRSGCTTWDGLGGLGGAVIGAGGTGIVAVLVLRAMSEWRKDLDVEEPPDA